MEPQQQHVNATRLYVETLSFRRDAVRYQRLRTHYPTIEKSLVELLRLKLLRYSVYMEMVGPDDATPIPSKDVLTTHDEKETPGGGREPNNRLTLRTSLEEEMGLITIESELIERKRTPSSKNEQQRRIKLSPLVSSLDDLPQAIAGLAQLLFRTIAEEKLADYQIRSVRSACFIRTPTGDSRDGQAEMFSSDIGRELEAVLADFPLLSVSKLEYTSSFKNECDKRYDPAAIAKSSNMDLVVGGTYTFTRSKKATSVTVFPHLYINPETMNLKPQGQQIELLPLHLSSSDLNYYDVVKYLAAAMENGLRNLVLPSGLLNSHVAESLLLIESSTSPPTPLDLGTTIAQAEARLGKGEGFLASQLLGRAIQRAKSTKTASKVSAFQLGQAQCLYAESLGLELIKAARTTHSDEYLNRGFIEVKTVLDEALTQFDVALSTKPSPAESDKWIMERWKTRVLLRQADASRRQNVDDPASIIELYERPLKSSFYQIALGRKQSPSTNALSTADEPLLSELIRADLTRVRLLLSSAPSTEKTKSSLNSMAETALRNLLAHGIEKPEIHNLLGYALTGQSKAKEALSEFQTTLAVCAERCTEQKTVEAVDGISNILRDESNGAIRNNTSTAYESTIKLMDEVLANEGMRKYRSLAVDALYLRGSLKEHYAISRKEHLSSNVSEAVQLRSAYEDFLNAHEIDKDDRAHSDPYMYYSFWLALLESQIILHEYEKASDGIHQFLDSIDKEKDLQQTAGWPKENHLAGQYLARLTNILTNKPYDLDLGNLQSLSATTQYEGVPQWEFNTLLEHFHALNSIQEEKKQSILDLLRQWPPISTNALK